MVIEYNDDGSIFHIRSLKNILKTNIPLNENTVIVDKNEIPGINIINDFYYDFDSKKIKRRKNFNTKIKNNKLINTPKCKFDFFVLVDDIPTMITTIDNTEGEDIELDCQSEGHYQLFLDIKNIKYKSIKIDFEVRNKKIEDINYETINKTGKIRKREFEIKN